MTNKRVVFHAMLTLAVCAAACVEEPEGDGYKSGAGLNSSYTTSGGSKSSGSGAPEDCTKLEQKQCVNCQCYQNVQGCNTMIASVYDELTCGSACASTCKAFCDEWNTGDYGGVEAANDLYHLQTEACRSCKPSKSNSSAHNQTCNGDPLCKALRDAGEECPES